MGGQPEPPDDVLVGRLRGPDAFIAVYHQAFRLERAGRDRQQADLDRFIALTSAVPVLMLEHRRRWELLPQVVDAVTEAVADLA
jgi:hypothetical protein